MSYHHLAATSCVDLKRHIGDTQQHKLKEIDKSGLIAVQIQIKRNNVKHRQCQHGNDDTHDKAATKKMKATMQTTFATVVVVVMKTHK